LSLTSRRRFVSPEADEKRCVVFVMKSRHILIECTEENMANILAACFNLLRAEVLR
jgi:hypothetical protein